MKLTHGDRPIPKSTNEFSNQENPENLNPISITVNKENEATLKEDTILLIIWLDMWL